MSAKKPEDGLASTVTSDVDSALVGNQLATVMLVTGIPEKTAMLISGHKTRSMFDRYTIIDEKDIEPAGQKLAGFEKAEKEVRAVGQKGAEEAGAGNTYNG